MRTFPLRFSNIRSDGINNWDISILKNTQIREKIKVQFRAEFLNTMNHAMMSNPSTGPYSSAFGTVNTEKDNPRRIQLGIKLIY